VLVVQYFFKDCDSLFEIYSDFFVYVLRKLLSLLSIFICYSGVFIVFAKNVFNMLAKVAFV